MVVILSRPQCVNILRAEQNDQHFASNIWECIFLKETKASVDVCPPLEGKSEWGEIIAEIQQMVT